MKPLTVDIPDHFEVKIVAAFLGVKSLPKLIALAFNNFNPKLVLSNDRIEYRAFIFTNRLAYSEIERVDIFLAPKTTNVYLIRNNSIFTVSANTNNNYELYKCLKHLKAKGCTLTVQAEKFYIKFLMDSGNNK